MILKLNEIYYPHCEIDSGTLNDLRQASSMGRFYQANIRRRFGCGSSSLKLVKARPVDDWSSASVGLH
jgi:hypothetical protein